MPEQPVVILLGCREDEADFLGNNNEFTEKIFGVRPEFVIIDPDCTEAWWAGLPSDAVQMIGLERLADQVKKDDHWPQSEDHYFLEEKSMNLVVCAGKYSENQEHVREVITRIFPYAAVHFKPSQFRGTEYNGETGINELGLSSRTRNVLGRNGIRTLGDLISLSPSRLRDVKNVGPQMLHEVIGNLARHGLSLVDD